jgi:hypothetical protein
MLLIVAFSIQVTNKILIAGWFSANRQELTALFCINKQNPDSECKGNCYLSKKLKETEQETHQGTSLPTKHKSATEEVWFCEKLTYLLYHYLLKQHSTLIFYPLTLREQASNFFNHHVHNTI